MEVKEVKITEENLVSEISSILDSKFNLDKKEGYYFGELYLDYSDYDVDYSTLLEILKNEDPRESALEKLNEWHLNYCDCEYDYILNEIKNIIGDDNWNGFEHKIIDYVHENVCFDFPSDFLWNADILTNIVIDAYNESNEDFTNNTMYEGELLEGGIKWLIQQQGYKVEDFEKEVEELENSEGGFEFSNKFFNSVNEELFNATYSMNQLTLFVKMTLEDVIKIKEQVKEGNLKEIQISKDVNLGLMNPWNGSGSMLEIVLEKDIIIPKEFIFTVNYDGGDGYGAQEIYGLGDDYWTQSKIEVR